jgi:alpha-2-macroglobulin-like protein
MEAAQASATSAVVRGRQLGMGTMRQRSQWAVLLWGLSISSAAVGCENSGRHAASDDPRGVNTASMNPPGISPDAKTRSDIASNGSVEVDESGLRGVVKDKEIELSIAVRGVLEGKGSVVAELIQVDGSKVLSTDNVEYELKKDEGKTLTAHVDLPEDVQRQSDRAAYSVRVHDGKSSLHVTRSLMYVLAPYELRLEGPSTLRADKPGSYRVLAQDPRTRAPVVDQAISLDLKRGADTVNTLRATTDEAGSAIFSLDVDEPGEYAVAVTDGTDELSTAVQVRDAGQKVLLTTDKPIYQPGQTMHLRAMALQNTDNKPLAGQMLLFEVADGKGNKVFKKSRKTDDYGIASIDFKLATLVNMGSYKLQVSGPGTAEKTVEVSRYVLPKFEVRVATDRTWYAPGDALRGTIDSRYFFGKTLSGADVSIEAFTLDAGSELFQRVMGKTDAEGHFAFSVDLPDVLVGIPLQDGNALVTLRTKVTDIAGQVVQKDTPITVAQAGIQLSLIPEATQVIPGLENRFHVFATDPLGAPIPEADIAISGATTASAKTDAYGHAELKWMIPSGAGGSAVFAELTTREGTKAQASFDFTAQTGAEHVLVRTDKSIYTLGETVKVQVIGTRKETRAYIDWLNDGQTTDMRTVDLKDGMATFEVNLDSSLAGENRIEAYVVDDGGNVARAGRTIVAQHDGGLRVALTQDKADYKPGEPAKLTFSVTDSAGKPAPSALGVQIVDEAVFGLIDARPGLLRTFFELEDSFAMPSYEIHAPPVSFEKLLFEDAVAEQPEQKRAAQAQAEAQLSALRGQRMLGVSLGTWATTVAQAKSKLQPFLTTEQKRAGEALKPLVKTASEALAAMGCKPDQYYCSALSSDYLTAITKELMGKAELFDFWGAKYLLSSQAYSTILLTSPGPDEQRSTDDDLPISLTLGELGLMLPAIGSPTFGPGVGFGMGAAGAAAAGQAPPAQTPATVPPTTPSAQGGTASNPSNGDSAGPRVRSDFPETMYVNPALITDADGKASVSVDVADSITSWRVSTLANSQSGALGGGQGAIKVFQDFFVDIGFPAELTRGDQVEFPVVVYNYLKTDQTVRLELEASAWFTALAQTNVSVTVGPGEVKSVKIPVRVEKVGSQTLTVRAFGTNASDAIARSVRVVPDGMAVPQARSGSLKAGSVSLNVSVPSNAIAGSPQLYLDVYPGYSSQAVKGLDSMLQVPSGCFEQTTSTTWPNVLVARYLDETKQNTPEIQLTTETLISAGYQRLLTFEHSSGGFSWYGEQDPKADVSVTAFGLMEFADMAKVSEVDPAMITRTQNWLASQQASDGSFEGGMTEFFSFQTSALRNTAFTVWAFAESGFTGDAVSRGLDYVREQIKGSMDTYSLALAANALAAAAPDDAALADLLAKLDAAKLTEGSKIHWASGTQQTSFYGGGTDSDVSTTALIAHAMLCAKSYGGTVKGALEYLIGSKDTQGNFGSTQASIWALKALMLAIGGGETAVGQLTVSVDGQTFNTVSLTKEESDITARVDMSSLATTGSHTVSLSFAGTGELGYNLVSSHHLPWSAAPRPTGPLSIGVTYDRTSLGVDEMVAAKLTVNNTTGSTQNMLLVTVGLPPGFDLQTEDLDAYVASGTISRYERTAKQLIVYVTELSARSKLELTYHLRATMPLRAADGGSRVALYYQPDQKAASSSTTLVVTGG